MAEVLTLINGKLRIDKSGSRDLVVSDEDSEEGPCCCGGCRYFWFGIFNINAVTDDNVYVSINGKDLGILDLSANKADGWIIHTGPKPELNQISRYWFSNNAPLGGLYPTAVFKKIYKADLRVDANSVTTTLAQPGFSGNFGQWVASLWSKIANDTCRILNGGTYGNPPATFSWNLTQAEYDALRDE